MIPEYKMYHGAVLAELVCVMTRPISVDELSEGGRLSSYVLDGRIGLHIKHSTQRLSPWHFTFTSQNYSELNELSTRCRGVFAVLVCNHDGMVCLPLSELLEITGEEVGEQSGIRITRRRGKWYSVSGHLADDPHKRPDGLGPVVAALGDQPSPTLQEVADAGPTLLGRLAKRISAFGR